MSEMTKLDAALTEIRSKHYDSHLIDGAIEEAKSLGIETDASEMLARYKEEWSR